MQGYTAVPNITNDKKKYQKMKIQYLKEHP